MLLVRVVPVVDEEQSPVEAFLLPVGDEEGTEDGHVEEGGRHEIHVLLRALLQRTLAPKLAAARRVHRIFIRRRSATTRISSKHIHL